MEEERGDCSRQRLASGRCCCVDLCGHGVAHVTIGALSLRLTREQLVVVAETLGEAARALGFPAATRPERLC
jgi:hypothetical protein